MHMDESGSESYSDFEVQIIGHNLNIDQGNQSAGAESRENFELVDSGGIDHDELAELVAVRSYYELKLRDYDDAENTDVGYVLGESSLGINLDESEDPTQAFTNAATAGDAAVQEDTTNGDASGDIFVLDEPGVIDYFTGTVEPPAYDTTNSSGAGGAGMSQIHSSTVNFRDMFGSGPYLDRNDDLVTFQEVGHVSYGFSSLMEATHVLYWDVQTTAGGRPSFAPPSHGD